jgi:hypothetical protein
MHRLFINGGAAGVREFSIRRSHSEMQFPCDGVSEEESWQARNEIAAANVDLDSVDDNGTAPEKEEELLGEEE